MASVEPQRAQTFSIYEGGAKIAEMESTDYTLDSNDELHHTDGGGAFSDGRCETSINVNTVHVTEGAESKFVSAITQKKTLRIQVGVIEGAIHGMPMRCMQAKWNREVKNGMAKGAFTFRGFEPEVT
jgi:hypothetical protein